MRDFKGMKRQRGRNRGGGGGGKPQQQNANRSFDSNGPDGVKVRGNAQHVFEKYQQLARDASSAGDRVLAEGYLQHADVLVVPHVVSDFTDSLDPLKLYEYQAVGRPVVSTPVAGFRDAAGVIIAGRDQFADAVATSIPSPAMKRSAPTSTRRPPASARTPMPVTD